MGFADLEARLDVLEPDNNEKYLSVLQSIRRSPVRKSAEYAEMIKYFLAINHHLEENGHTKSAYTIGGYAVMGYLVQEFGHEVCKVWRGSEDIDIVIRDPTVKAIIINSFVQRMERKSHIPNKYSLEVKDEATKLPDLICEVDLYHCWGKDLRINQREISQDFFDNSTTVNLCGVSVSLPGITDLIKLKIDVQNYEGALRPKDRADIVDLVSILVNRGTTLNDLYPCFTGEENSVLVNQVFGHADRPAPTAGQLAGKERLAQQVDTFSRQYSAYHKCAELELCL